MTSCPRDHDRGVSSARGRTRPSLDAARKMQELDVGALPICGEDNRLKGMITDRDIVREGRRRGPDPARATAGTYGQGEA